MEMKTTKEAAAYLKGIKPETLVAWRHRGQGPKYVPLGKRIVYSVADLDAFMRSRTVTPKPRKKSRKRAA